MRVYKVDEVYKVDKVYSGHSKVEKLLFRAAIINFINPINLINPF